MHFYLNPADVLYLAGTCEACGNQFHTHLKTLRNTDLHSVGTCNLCTKSVCSDCKYNCDCCNKTVCRKCTANCTGCGEGTCKTCLTNGRCSFCANDEDARMDALNAGLQSNYQSIDQFSNCCWFCIALGAIGVVAGILWLYIQKGWQ